MRVLVAMSGGVDSSVVAALLQEAGHEGVDRKAKPWEMDPGLARAQHERTRKAAAALIGGTPAVGFADGGGGAGWQSSIEAMDEHDQCNFIMK